MPADVTIVVVTYNSENVIVDLLESLPAALDGLDADVVVVDNGSSDGTADLIEGRTDCRVIRGSNVGYAGGLNAGVRASSPAGAVLVLNPDLRLHPASVRRMMAALELPNTGVVAPKVLGGDGSVQWSLRREPSLARTLGLNGTGLPWFAEYMVRSEEYASPRSVDWALGAVLLMSRTCYDALGGWDESYFLYSEETDFCLRARDIGYRTRYEPSAVATHIGGQSGQSNKTHAMQIVNRVRLYRRRHGVIASWTYLVLTALREVSWIPRGVGRNRHAVVALFRPGRRPPELRCSEHIMPA